MHRFQLNLCLLEVRVLKQVQEKFLIWNTLPNLHEIRRPFYNAYLTSEAARVKCSDVAPQPWEQTASTFTVMANPDWVELDGLRGLNVSGI